MTDEKTKVFVPKAPDYKGDGVALWVKADKNGKCYFTVKILGGSGINLFLNEQKQVEEGVSSSTSTKKEVA